ncbi:hypothetical protein PVIIG_05885 [Plasmodium vivax India VII]|uniref:PIR Superfamily Protein n=1 Tax=Plasmodium vivax India VII TaxID=1077284 RepID=A0A0J9S363_PLAVI|nr:hypothetical protein PVIIG_05885 [Plasmodium vivax India VII]
MDDVLDECNGSTCNKSCDYMNLWLYDQAMRITNEKFFIDSFYQALNILAGISKSKKHQCSIKTFELNEEELNKKQILYEFLHIYDGIKKELQSPEDDSKIKLYCKHILENFGFYHENKGSCTSTELCKYCDELTDFKSKFSNPAELSYVYQKCKYEKTTCKNGSNAEDDVPCLREEGNFFLYLIFGNDPEDVIKVLLNVTIISAPILALLVILFKVLNYDKYIEYKRRFGPVKTFSSERITLDEILRKAKITNDMETKYSKAFNVLLHHIKHDGIFVNGNDLDACKYINYILYKEVEYNIGQNYDENLKSNFKQILEAYSTIHGGNNRCTYDIYNMQSDTYHKIKALYELYDKNEKCISYDERVIQYVCKDFEDFLSLYDNYMFATYSKSSKFYDILKNMEEHAKKAASRYKIEYIHILQEHHYILDMMDIYRIKLFQRSIRQLEPSLEEVDACNGSLIDSTEDTQDFSQVFKDSKKGIFQTIELI